MIYPREPRFSDTGQSRFPGIGGKGTIAMTDRNYKTGREKYSLLPSGSISLTGTADSAARWVEREQLTDASLWAGFVNEYRVRTDDSDNA